MRRRPTARWRREWSRRARRRSRQSRSPTPMAAITPRATRNLRPWAWVRSSWASSGLARPAARRATDMDITDYFSGSGDPNATGYGTPLLLPQVSAAYRADPRRALIESMMATGQQSLNSPTYSPGAALAKALTIGLGGIANAKLNADYQDQNKAAQQSLADALSAPDQASYLKALTSSPALLPQATQLKQTQLVMQQKFRMEQDAEAAKQGLVNVWDPTGTTILAQHKLEGADTARGAIKQAEKAGEVRGQNQADADTKPQVITAETPALAAQHAAIATAENPALIDRAVKTEQVTAPIKVDTANKIEQGKVAPQSQINANKAAADAKYKTTTVGPGGKVVLEHPELANAPNAPNAPPSAAPSAAAP